MHIAVGGIMLTIEARLRDMHDAAEKGDYEAVERFYKSALARAQTLVGSEDAPLALLLMCMTRFYEDQGNHIRAEAFNRRVRQLAGSHYQKTFGIEVEATNSFSHEPDSSGA